MRDELLRQHEAAELLKLSSCTLGRWRRNGSGPPIITLRAGKGRDAVRYSRATLEDWLRSREGHGVRL